MESMRCNNFFFSFEFQGFVENEAIPSILSFPKKSGSQGEKMADFLRSYKRLCGYTARNFILVVPLAQEVATWSSTFLEDTV